MPGMTLAKPKPAAPATEVIWLDKTAPANAEGTTFGVPWPRGTVKAGTPFALTANGASWPVQTWPLAYWPDGSLKWTAHAVAAAAMLAETWQLAPGTPAVPQKPVGVTQTADAFTVTVGDAAWTVAKSGKALVTQATRGGKPVMKAP